MLNLHEDIFAAFRDAARAQRIYPPSSRHAWADSAYSNGFERWQDELGIHEIDLSPAAASGYSRAWIFNLTSRPGNNRQWSTTLPLTIVACHTQTGKLAVLSVDSNIRHLRHLLSDDRELISVLSGEERLRPVFGVFSNKYYSHSINYEYLAKTLRQRAEKTSSQISVAANQASHALKYLGAGQAPLGTLAQETARHFLDIELNRALEAIDSHVDHEAMQFAEEFCANNTLKEKVTPLVIYNHVVTAAGPQGKGTRMGAIPVIAKSGSLFLDAPALWADIDSGTSLFAALGKVVGASAGTVKHMLRQPDLFGRGQKDFDETASWLDSITMQRWPATKAEVGIFNDMRTLASTYGTAFQRDARQTLAQWVKDSGARAGWRHIIFLRLKKTMRNLTRNAHETKTNLFKLLRDPKFWQRTITQYTSALNNINHAKQDVERRIMRAALYRSFESQGWRVTDENAVAQIESAIKDRLWRDCPPHEQIEVSDYWHSPNVNFGMRVSSLTQTEGMVWHSVVSGGVKLDNGVSAYPLASNDALREEGDAMHHCVWSYGYNCLKNGHHIFSLRDEKSRRISTLDLIEEWKDGVVHFKVREHKSVRNTPVPGAASVAAQQLIKKLEKADIDWDSIRRDRDAFSAKSIDLAIGYDFRDDEQAQKIFDLYRPCMPRKTLRQSGGSLDGLAQALGMDKMVADYLAKNPARPGLMPVQTRPAPEAPRLAAV